MSPQKLSERRRMCLLGLRAITTLSSTAAIAAFVIILNSRSSDAKGSGAFWIYLPVIALGFSTFWNVFSIITLFTGYAYYLPRTLHLSADVAAIVLLLILGFLGFGYDSTEHWETSLMPRSEQQLEIFGIALLGLDVIMHVVFLFHSPKGVSVNRTEGSAAPPSYEAAGQTCDDARSVRTLPEYSADGVERISLEKRISITVVGVEIV